MQNLSDGSGLFWKYLFGRDRAADEINPNLFRFKRPFGGLPDAFNCA